MNSSHRVFLCCIFFLFISLTGFPQINSLSVQDLSAVDIDKITDEEISAYYRKAMENGLTEKDIYRILQERGLPDEEINKLSERIDKISTEPEKNKKEDKKEPETDNKDRYSNQDAKKVPLESIKKDLNFWLRIVFYK